jgi:cyclopropane fatty-acyl-phospholipid synthase-like methyltransferase
MARRDALLRGIAAPYIGGKKLLELGCGEGHLTRSVFSSASSIVGIDLSVVALNRAEALNLPNAIFEVGNLLDISYSGYDVITAIECVYYLSKKDRWRFFEKAAREHSGILIFSAPIIGNPTNNYFTHQEIVEGFVRNGIQILKARNLSLDFQPSITRRIVRKLIQRPWGALFLRFLPDKLVSQRCYVVRCFGSVVVS